jgi:hypothetical protein
VGALLQLATQRLLLDQASEVRHVVEVGEGIGVFANAQRGNEAARTSVIWVRVVLGAEREVAAVSWAFAVGAVGGQGVIAVIGVGLGGVGKSPAFCGVDAGLDPVPELAVGANELLVVLAQEQGAGWECTSSECGGIRNPQGSRLGYRRTGRREVDSDGVGGLTVSVLVLSLVMIVLAWVWSWAVLVLSVAE